MNSLPRSFIFIFFIYSLTVFSFANISLADGLAAVDILTRMKKVYLNAQTYQDRGLVKVVIRFPERDHTVKKPFTTAAGISGGSARTVPTLLLPEESRFRNPILLYSPKRTEDEVIDGLDCYRIEDPSDYRNLTLWIDKETFLLRKIYTYQDFQDSQAESTTAYKPILNGVVTEKMLEFGSPK